MTGEVIGAVLAGGRSRRVGGDKPLLEVGGQTLARRAVDALRLARLDVTLVLRAHQPVPLTAHTISVIRDEVADAGPLGGLHALLRWLPAEWALVVPCDQPFLTPDLLRGLLAQPREDADAIVGRPANLPEPLPGLYRRSSLGVIERALNQGERSLRELLSKLRLREIPAATLCRWDPRLLSYLNVNTPADLEEARALVAPVDREHRELQETLSHRR
ncbi:MAG: molybdenum cofactor guanylyltransferase [Chloroflexi bacterium]|nr:molybdenum cofactor guanylyltransferase [Chloroflexota bacterium]